MDAIGKTAVEEIPKLMASNPPERNRQRPVIAPPARTPSKDRSASSSRRVTELAARLESLGQAGDLHAAREVPTALGNPRSPVGRA